MFLLVNCYYLNGSRNLLFASLCLVLISGITLSSSQEVNMKQLQQILNYNPEVLEKINRLNFGSTFDNHIRVKLKHKGQSEDADDESSPLDNSVDVGNQNLVVGDEDFNILAGVKDSIIEQYLVKITDPESNKKKIIKKLNIPEGSQLGLTVQVSRPDVFPGIFNQGDAVVMDAVIEIPLTFELDAYAKHVYEDKPKPLLGSGKPTGKPEKPTGDGEKAKLLGYERCYMYEQVEAFIAQTMEVSTSTSHACILRAICEIHSLLRFRPEYSNASVVFELLIMLLTPSSGADDDCFAPYIHAERAGRNTTLCYSYHHSCPISLASLLMSNFVA